MPEEKERPRPHGDPLRDEIDDSRGRDDDQTQKQKDAPTEHDADGERRRQHYEEGAGLVSRID